MRPTGEGFSASNIAPPENLACGERKRFPLSCSAGDLDQDGDRDLVVFDPSCFGSWTAYQTGPGEMSPAPGMEGLPPTPELHFLQDLTGDGAPELLAAAPDWVEVLSLSAPPRRWDVAIEFTLPTIGYVDWFPTVFQTFRRNGVPRILIQGSSRLWALDLNNQDGSLASAGPIDLAFSSSEYLKPFVGFDAVQPLSFDGCEGAFAGIGRLPAHSGGIPPSLQIVEVSALGYAPSTVSLPIAARSMASVSRPTSGDAILLVLGDGDDGQTKLAVVAVRPCHEAMMLGLSTVSLSFRTPLAPQEYTEDRLAMRAIPLIARLASSEERIEAFTYDGFAVHRFRTSPATAWTVTHEQFTIHEERYDLAY